ncbi:hypothetical protein [uncultured Bacteroides sp.]|uniref:hypothetical protein n=1 Tax=uncultured Bacteroides sp. TaxID=162156 RepID=UPI0026140621|nr:hypothetical protein [uncultured Bacteroides sp.]
MKKLLLILLGVFTLSTVSVYAQEVEQDAKAVKLQEKEAKRKAKEEAKAKKAKEKAEKKAAKDKKKDKRIEKLRAEYADFIANYEPLDTNTGYAEIDTFMINANNLFAIMVEVEQEIGYIEVVMEDVEDEMTGEVTKQATGIRNKHTQEPIKKSDALKAYGSATLKLLTAAAEGTSLTANGVTAILSSITDPMALLTIGGKAKKVMKQVKMTVEIIPIIRRDIQENTDALKFYKDNLAGEVEEEVAPVENTAN